MSHRVHVTVSEAAEENEVAVGVNGWQGKGRRRLRRGDFSGRLGERCFPLHCRKQTVEGSVQCINVAKCFGCFANKK